MSSYVQCFAIVASFKLIHCAPICVDCLYNFALDSKCVDVPPKCVFFGLRDAGTTQTHCIDAFLPNSEPYR